MNFKLTASMMCADYGNLEREVKELESGGGASIPSILILWTGAMCLILPCR